MKISKLYDMTWKIPCQNFSRYIYKVNKLLVNLVYPRIVKLEWGINEDSDVIVSLTSFPARIDTVWMTIATLLNQTVKPGRIILWLADDQFPNGVKDLPQRLLDLEKCGLSIRFCENLYPHKKYFYTMKEYPNATVVTVDDDVFYPENLVEDLLELSRQYPRTVCCTWAHKITLDDNGKIKPYVEWQRHAHEEKPSFCLLPVGVGGVLYPPNSLNVEAFDKKGLSEVALMTDDLWLKTMEILGGTKAIRISKPYRQPFFSILRTQKDGLHFSNVGNNQNDKAIWKIEDRYPTVRTVLQNEQ